MRSQHSRVLGRAVAGVILAAAVLLLGAGSAHAAFPGKNGEIAFDGGGESAGIRAMQPDGSRQRVVGMSGVPKRSRRT